MAQLATAPALRRSVLRRLLWIVACGLGAATLLVAGPSAWFYHACRAALPQLDGAIRVQGISFRVTVMRDGHGVPHITAGNLEDLLFAQGYVTAQDRLWQMDMARRAAAGELSEVLGRQWLELDRQQRILLLPWVAERAAAALSERDRKLFEAYARGVNAFVAARRDRLPIEFRILRYFPRPWTVKDSFLIVANMHQILNDEQRETKLVHEAVLARIGPELTADLYPSSSSHDRPPTEPAGGSAAGTQAAATQAAVTPAAKATRDEQLLPGSNNWVVSGAHTLSGKPLLANDMHLGHRIPNVWYEAHLRAGDFDVAGVTLPGFPYVIVGHNQRIAWGFTNLNPDVQDLFIETFNERGEYRTPSGWKLPQRRHEIIHVRDAADVSLDVVITRHGPIISALIPGEARQLALQWTIYEPAATSLPFPELNQAEDWQQFLAALAHFSGPSQNVVYGDVDGHIGYHASGLIPVRASSKGDSELPVRGDDGAHDWVGHIRFEQLPGSFDPASGTIATANGRIVPKDYPRYLGHDWMAPWRTERIYQVLESGKKLAASDMLALENDVHSEFDLLCAQAFVRAIDRAQGVSDRARRAAEVMRGWSGDVTTESAAASIVTAARAQLWRMLLEPKLGPVWREYLNSWAMASVAMEKLLVQHPARWLPPGHAAWNDLLAAAVEAAVRAPDTPADVNSWRWGKRSSIELQHPLFGHFPLVRRWSGPGTLPQSGNGFTVKQVGRQFGPSERMTVDFSDLDASTLNIVTGQSGQLFSPYYMDQWPYWYQGRSFTLPFSEAAVQRAATHQLTLEPESVR